MEEGEVIAILCGIVCLLIGIILIIIKAKVT
jgi:hypothetical protein